MRRLRWLLYGLRTAARRATRQRDLDAELQFHIDAEAEERMADGLAEHEARQAARRSLGNLALVREEARAVWTWGAAERLLQDLRYAIRVLARERSFTATALLTIVLLVGGTTAVFTLVNSVLFRPLPYPESRRIAMIQAVDDRRTTLTYDEAQRLQRVATSFDRWGLYRPGYVVTLDRSSDHPLPVQDMRITPGLFPLLGIRVVLGRPLVADDELDANPDVGVISFDLWHTRFAGATDVIGRTFAWRDGRTLTVVGVTAPGADVPTNWLSAGGRGLPIVWNPIRVSNRSGPSIRFAVLARLKSDRSMGAASRELAGLGIAGPSGRRFEATGLLDRIVGDTQRVLWVLFAAVLAVLFIGVANLVSLQLVRNARRERELGVRAALGAGRWRLVRQLATESLVLGVLGGAGGLFAATNVIKAVVATLPRDFPRAGQISIDGPVWAFAIVVSAIVTLAIGLLPAVRVVRPGLAQRVNTATLSRRRAGIQRGLIVFETAAALVLLVGAALLVNSLGRLLSQNAGMHEQNLWVVRGALPPRYQSPRDTEYWTNALRLIRELPGVERATITMNDGGPLAGGDISFGGLEPEGGASSAEGFSLSYRNVGPDYFETLGIPIVAGRSILESDVRSGERVVVLNQLAASTMWPGDSAIGKRLGDNRWRLTVVGIVPDFKLTRLDGDVSMQMYVPYTQDGTPAGASAILVRARPDAQALGDRMKAVLLNLEKDLQGVDASTMSQVRWKLVAAERFRTTVLAGFAFTATFLALVGVFGLVAYSVGQRTQEIGLRLALGSTCARTAALMVRQALVPAAIGTAAGLVGAVIGSRVLETFLFEIEPTDPVTFAAAIGLFLAASATAAVVPALRAFKIDPAAALRHE